MGTDVESEKEWQVGMRKEVCISKVFYIWTISHAYFATAISLTCFVTLRVGSVVLIASIGCSWAVTLWAPYYLIGLVLSQQQCLLRDDDGTLGGQGLPEAGAISGFHNAAISAPQIISALLSSVIFAVFNGTESGVGWAMRFGACWTAIAAYLSWKLARNGEFF